ncbi:sensor histidine kinase [Neptuniibacter caesariensis]|uniref:histidine kinase n=1 Tax=Neptuniibacter caesariensis TaxID=207954 RepID=A0A7U8C8Q2_NEPCE|nr:sensor histidine kinase [Neptuniibacter caesariensis]EAR62626.1 sensory box histidine kinase [Oceanospirillum sp. MED92] [Neptuniibacter caesariensis]
MAAKTTFWSLRAILSTQFLIVAAVPIVIASLLSIFLLLPRINQNIFINQQALANSIAGQITTYLANAESDINVLASFAMQEQTLLTEQYDLLNIYTNNQAYFSAIYITDNKGHIRNIGLPSHRQFMRQTYLNLDMSNSHVFKGIKERNIAQWSNEYLSTISGSLSIAYSQPFIEGVLVGEIAIEELPKLVEKLAKQNNVTVMVLDQNKQLIAHPDAQLSQQQINLSNLELVQRTDAGESLSIPFEFDNQQFIGSATLIPNLNWMVIVAQPQKLLEGEQAAIRDIFIAAVLIGIVSAMFIALLLTKELVMGFYDTARQARSLARGKYSETPQYSRILELYKLREDLNKTGQEIEKRENHITQLNTELEQRVEERTEDLRHSHAELEQTLHDLKLTQEQLIHSEKLSALGSLVAGVSHELNTPIGNSLMAATTLKESVDKVVKKTDQNQLTKKDFDHFIHESSEGSEILVKNLYRASELIHSFKQVAVDQSSAKKRRFELGQHINEVLTTLRPQLKKTRIEVTSSLEGTIHLDSFPGALSQILTNLIQNALVHAFDDKTPGHISISASYLDDRTVELIVTDDGKGMTQDMINSIFDPFYTTKLGQGGSGLGLHIVHNLISNVLEGQICVQSEPGKGTTMKLHFPSAL